MILQICKWEGKDMTAKSRLVIYDTTNFIDFPIGGQLTSVRNFLSYLCEMHADRIKDIILVGVTKELLQIGRFSQINVHGHQMRFLAVTSVEENLGHTVHSLRLKYAKGLIKYGRMLHLNRTDCNYFQTPEAVGPVWLIQPFGKYVVFSHGSFANMDRGFRFFQNRPVIRKMFTGYLKWVVRKADLIFILDEDSRRDYCSYTKRLKKTGNSIVLADDFEKWKAHEYCGNLIFVGRLSKGKRVADIINAVSLLHNNECLLIVGDGEERNNLENLVKQINMQERVSFLGAVIPKKVSSCMDNADILIMNSDFEGVPMTILEAFSHGLPVVTTNVGGIGENVHFGLDAEQTEASPESIAFAVEKIRGNYVAYAEAAHQHALDFDYRKVNSKIYDSLCHFWKE